MPVPETSIIIAGVGLIGGSIAAAIRKRFPKCQVIGIGRSAERLSEAQRRGLLTSWSTEVSVGSLPPGSLGVVCLPVDQIASCARQLVHAGCELVTDAGSVKASICDALTDVSDQFVGAHPIAGSERSGAEFADADLFADRLCVVTPQQNSQESVDRVTAFWKSIGMSVRLMSADEHDRILALTSHLPHVLASVAVSCVKPEELEFTGTGFRDTTRIAAGGAELWSSILFENSRHCVDAIHQAEAALAEFREAIATGDVDRFRRLWERAASVRRMLPERKETDEGR
jgi:prephenate dehydrogenase